jgi:type III restriction enzyme
MPPPCKWLCQAIEQHYLTHLKKTLAKPQLDTAYRAYLERTAKAIDQVHKGYFAASHSDKSQEEAISLILKEKEKLLSTDTDLRFIFSMWALQEGWDNPSVAASYTTSTTKRYRLCRFMQSRSCQWTAT